MAKHEITADSALKDYATDEFESFEDFAEFSPRYQFFRLYRTCLTLQVNQQYPRSRKTFYDNLGWFSVTFDAKFVERCNDIINKYEQPKYHEIYVDEQIEQLKYMRIIAEFTRLLIDASSKSRAAINLDPTKHVELTPVGYSQILNYEHMSLEFFNRLTQVQQQQGHRDAVKFFYHGMGWFGGIFDTKFIMQGYIIGKASDDPETKYRKLVTAFSKLLTRKSIMPTVFASLIYKPHPTDDVPHTRSDIIKPKSGKTQKTQKLQSMMQERDISAPSLPLPEPVTPPIQPVVAKPVREYVQVPISKPESAGKSPVSGMAGVFSANARKKVYPVLTTEDVLYNNDVDLENKKNSGSQ